VPRRRRARPQPRRRAVSLDVFFETPTEERDARRPERLAQRPGGEHVRLGDDPLALPLERGAGDEHPRADEEAPLHELSEAAAQLEDSLGGNPRGSCELGRDPLCVVDEGCFLPSQAGLGRTQPSELVAEPRHVGLGVGDQLPCGRRLPLGPVELVLLAAARPREGDDAFVGLGERCMRRDRLGARRLDPPAERFELGRQSLEQGEDLLCPAPHVPGALGDVREGIELARERRVPTFELGCDRDELCVGACHHPILQMRTPR